MLCIYIIINSMLFFRRLKKKKTLKFITKFDNGLLDKMEHS